MFESRVMPTELVCQPAAVRFPRALHSLTFALAICFALVGCGEGDPPLVPVSGFVTLDGKPLKDATVEFLPESGWGSMGKTDDIGHYELLYRVRKNGAIIGQHKVRISTKIEEDSDSADPVVQKGRKESVPARYNTATTLEANVEPGESVELNFDLKS
jgi:hypothetical protein